MDAFKLSSTYDAIYIPSGSFQLLTSKEQAINALQCIRQHLADGGFLLVDIFIPWGEIRLQKLRSYAVTRDVTRADGWRSVVMERFEIDLPQQIKRGTYRYEFYQGNRLAESLIDELHLRWYWKEEFLLLLQKAGFSDVQMLSETSLYQEGEGFVFKVCK
jgi:SAM-dependent methyltransferase